MEKDYKKGQNVIIELENECFSGDIHYMNKDHTRIELINVHDFITGEIISGPQNYYKSDIKSIRIIKDAYNEDTIESEDEDKKSDSGCETNIVNLTATELEDIDKLVKNAKYIYQTDRSYHAALKDIAKESVVALNLEGCKMGRHNKTTVLTIATKDNVYIFDIISLGKIFPEMKHILEARKPRKIVHDGRKVLDNLKHRQNVQLHSIYDTFVSHVALGGDKNIMNLRDCINLYINFPDSYFPCEKNINWNSRPLDNTRTSIAAKKVIFIFKLYEVFLHEYMLQNYSEVCHQFSNVFSSNKNSGQVALDIASNNNSSIEEISDIGLDIDLSLATDQFDE